MKKYKLKLNRALALNMQKNKSMLSAAKEAHIGYPTFCNMAHGKWNTRALDVLARFLMVCGLSAHDLQTRRFSDIFFCEEYDDGHPE